MTDAGGPPVIHVVAAVVVDPAGRVLLVRKRGTSAFMNPGGKPEPGESPEEALIRELAEEVGLRVALDRLRYLGRFSAAAANEPGHTVEAEVYGLRVADGRVGPQQEIDEVVWIDPAEPPIVPLAPLAADHLLALARTER